MLAKSRVVLYYIEDELNEIGGYASYYSIDGDATNDMLELPVDKWEDFGKPAMLTITIEPGDLLNEESDA